MITTLIFDMDDTLYDEIDYCRSGFHAVDAYLSTIYATDAGAIFDALWTQFNAGNHTTTFNAALDSLDIAYDKSTIKDLIAIYREHKPDISLDEQTFETLDTLSQKYSLALITDGFLPAQKLKIAALGLGKFFKCIVCTEELGREYWKPHPKGFELILEKLQADPEKTACIADNAKKDFIAPNAMSITTIQLIRPNKVHLTQPQSPQTAPKHTIYSITYLPKLLESF
ncbi:MAG: HAD family hydrolase [Planctomycetes bacterium]|nr:HAD family hydrolase [Planctomycetota bacterium]